MKATKNPNFDYNVKNNIVYSCKFYIVWCTKYRRKVLTEEIQVRLREVLTETANEYNTDVFEIKLDVDTVYMKVDVDPYLGIQPLVRILKGKTSRTLRDEFSNLKKQLPTLWTNSCFIATYGEESVANIDKYIANQMRSESYTSKQNWYDYLDGKI